VTPVTVSPTRRCGQRTDVATDVATFEGPRICGYLAGVAILAVVSQAATALTTTRGQRSAEQCRNAHDLTGADALIVSRRTRDGVAVMRCRECAREANARWAARKAAIAQGEAIPDGAAMLNTRRSFYRPRQPMRPRSEPTFSVDEDRVPTTNLLGVLPQDLAGHIAGVLMHPPRTDAITQAQLAVIQRAIRRPAFVSTPPNTAVALFIEALVDATRDSERGYFRVDRLLALVLA
jgi:hypothetical protein